MTSLNASQWLPILLCKQPEVHTWLMVDAFFHLASTSSSRQPGPITRGIIYSF